MKATHVGSVVKEVGASLTKLLYRRNLEGYGIHTVEWKAYDGPYIEWIFPIL